MDASEIIRRFGGGATVSALASEMVPLMDDAAVWAAALDAKAEEIEAVIRADLRQLYQEEALALQAPGRLAAVFDQQCIAACAVGDSDEVRAAYRAGYAAAKHEASVAVSHLENVIRARVRGVTVDNGT